MKETESSFDLILNRSRDKVSMYVFSKYEEEEEKNKDTIEAVTTTSKNHSKSKGWDHLEVGLLEKYFFSFFNFFQASMRKIKPLEQKLKIPRRLAVVGIPIFSAIFVFIFFGAGFLYTSLS